MSVRIMLSIACALLSLVGEVNAHEFWIRPGTFEARPGALGKFFLMHGHRFDGEFVPRNNPYVKRFELISSNEVQSVLGRHGQSTNVARFGDAGTNIVVYESEEVRSELGAERFAAYLEEQGLDHVVEQRKARGEDDQPGTEVYVRCAKALVRVFDETSTGATSLRDRVVGLPLELVLEPLEEDFTGGQARVRVLYRGDPLPNARVVAVSQQRMHEESASCVLQTDADGFANVPLDESGPWMLTCLHMIRTDDREDADWKSFWASLTFQVVLPPTAG